MTINAMTDEEMVAFLRASLPGHTISRPSTTRGRRNVRVSEKDETEAWIQIELDDEAFVIDVDLGFRYRDFAMERTEQQMILQDFVIMCRNYLSRNWVIRRRNRVLGGSREELILPGTEPGSELIFRRV